MNTGHVSRQNIQLPGFKSLCSYPKVPLLETNQSINTFYFYIYIFELTLCIWNSQKQVMMKKRLYNEQNA